jgi:peptidylprolyl isomerase
VRSSAAKALIGLGLGTVLLLVGACGKDAASPNATATATSTTPSASPSASPSATAAKVTPSTNFDKITVTGDYGKAPKLEIKAPWRIDKTRTEVLKANKSGPEVKQGATVEVNYAGYNARTGKKFDDSYSRGSTASFNIDQVVPGFKKGLLGQHQGSRVLIAMPGPDGYDASGGNPDIDVQVGDTLVFVVDIVAVPLTGPEGTAVTPKSGLPIVTDKGGKPQITIPKSKPPGELQIQPLIKGKGKKVAETDSITFNYIWQTWSDGKVVEQTYNSKPATASLAELVPGLVTGLTGQTVGSRVLLVIPPAQGYPDGNASPKIGKNETLVFVVDLLFTQS